MGAIDSNVWHQVHAQREDGVAAMFLIRDVDPRPDQPKIFVIELPYTVTDLSGQPDASGYRRLGAFQEQWLEPACAALGWTFVAWKSEDGSFFLYLYGAGDPEVLLDKLAPFDVELGFFNDLDADWSEYAALRELVQQAEAEGGEDGEDGEDVHVHSDACGHEHEHAGDGEAAFAGIQVIDLTGDEAAEAAWQGDARDDEDDDSDEDDDDDSVEWDDESGDDGEARQAAGVGAHGLDGTNHAAASGNGDAILARHAARPAASRSRSRAATARGSTASRKSGNGRARGRAAPAQGSKRGATDAARKPAKRPATPAATRAAGKRGTAAPSKPGKRATPALAKRTSTKRAAPRAATAKAGAARRQRSRR